MKGDSSRKKIRCISQGDDFEEWIGKRKDHHSSGEKIRRKVDQKESGLGGKRIGRVT